MSVNCYYTTKRGKKLPKIKTEMNGKGLTVHVGLLPVLTFMEKLLFSVKRLTNREIRAQSCWSSFIEECTVATFIVGNLIAFFALPNVT